MEFSRGDNGESAVSSTSQNTSRFVSDAIAGTTIISFTSTQSFWLKPWADQA